MDSLVTTDWLANELGAPDLAVVDATKFLDGTGRDPKAEYEDGHILGAVFLDLDELADKTPGAPHKLPPEHKFASRMQTLGIRDGMRIVVYDNSPLRSATRAWWLLKSFAAHHVSVLDGGLAKWKAEGRPLEAGRPQVRHGHFTPMLDPAALVDKAAVRAIVEAGGEQLVDARSAARFAGTDGDPRPGIAAGHIPGSRNLPQGQLFSEDGTWKRGDALRAAFEQAGVDLDRPMVTTCGSGVTATALIFGAHLLGRDGVRLYDGSWADWGSDPDTPKATGPA
ncbi:MAG TPA: 3-mercaptopyruvate sulfurtransferase [Allosphingosinicella sp.]|jgi:thiosulfate/3-mercaptopyruvate sulfurtransferase|uniref:3-mercaptopyruvate sulfurtransferase n=1 Tax=Allosphingosinicella sp. TaxID=2823234 RepID=UPI002F2922E5